MSARPHFAVVGHPNKGKSSLVATLAGDDSVAIGADPGTTRHCRRYPMKVDGEILYELIDTPGFQRARSALEWIDARATTAAEQADRVREFVEAHADTGQFPDECELLRPVVDGAGILYVVDGSVPYGPEYEAEMKILRYTGQPSMGLINPIGPADHLDEWRSALQQYFSVVRVFDAVRSTFQRRIELLEAFGQLREDWRAPLVRAVDSLRADRDRRRQRAARILADAIADCITMKREARLGEDADHARVRERLRDEFGEALRARERECRTQVEAVYDHHRLDRQEPALEGLNEDDLLSQRSLELFGLDRKQLLLLGAVGGGATGGLVDASLGGASLGAGILIGAGLGATSSLFAASRLADTRILTIPLGGRSLEMGPVRSIHLPHVLFNRARLHHALVAARTHAERGVLDLDTAATDAVAPLGSAHQRTLERHFAHLRRGWNPDAVRDELATDILAILAEDDDDTG